MRGNIRVAGTMFSLRAAVVFFAVALLFTPPAFAEVTVSGVPEWLTSTISGSMKAVWEEVGRTGEERQHAQLLGIVVSRLFPGVRLENIRIAEDDLFLDLSFSEPPSGGWRVHVEHPDLVPELDPFFAADVGDSAEILQEMISPIPVESLSWTGQAFQRFAGSLLAERVPGWSSSLIFMQDRDGGLEVEVSFQALSPVVVAYSPSIRSRTLPRVLQSEVTDDALEVLSPYIGLPGAWVARHESEIEKIIASELEGRWASRDIKGKVTVGIDPGRIAPVDVRVESEMYTLQAWAAVSIGSDERHPEVGIHLGRKTKPFHNWELELYGEWLASTKDLSIESRWGARWSAWPDIWVGAELAYPGEDIWYRFWVDEIIPKVYLWWRFSEDGDSSGALGWRFGEFLSGELYYDSRDGDGLGVRILGNL